MKYSCSAVKPTHGNVWTMNLWLLLIHSLRVPDPTAQIHSCHPTIGSTMTPGWDHIPLLSEGLSFMVGRDYWPLDQYHILTFDRDAKELRKNVFS